MTVTNKTARTQFEDLIHDAPEFTGEDFVLSDDTQYAEVLSHIEKHKYLTNQEIPYEISMREALFSWYENVYEPLMMAIDSENIVSAFPGKTRGDMFMWICSHWHFLKEEKKRDVYVEEAVRSFGAKFADGRFARFYYRMRTPA